MTLHEAIREILEQAPQHQMAIDNLAVENERQGLYRKRDGDLPAPKQFAMRAMNYPEFEVVVRLRGQQKRG